jgi:hypothetical protein
MMTLQGKGFFSVNLPDCESGNPDSILAVAQAAGLCRIMVKVADGTQAAGTDASGVDFTAPVVQAFQQAGMAVWGWQVVYGNSPAAEAAIAITRTQALGLDGYVVFAGTEFELSGRAGAAHQFISMVRAALKVPIALSSFRFPNYHPKFPWSEFLFSCDLHMPQVYWEQAHNADYQLRESKRQCDALPNAKPYIPTAAAYTVPGWSPTAQDVTDFLDTAYALDLPAVNFFNWDTCRANLPLSWKAIASFPWPAPAQGYQPAQTPTAVTETVPPSSPDALLLRYFAALNSRNAAQAAALYDPAAIQVWANQIRRDTISIQAGFAAFFSSVPTGTVFSITSAQMKDDLHTFSWKAGPFAGETVLTIKNGKIILDYTFFF